MSNATKQLQPQFELDLNRQGYDLVIGIDEAGRGPLAGPVVASAVCLKSFEFSLPVTDSKKLTHLQRERAFMKSPDNPLSVSASSMKMSLMMLIFSRRLI